MGQMKDALIQAYEDMMKNAPEEYIPSSAEVIDMQISDARSEVSSLQTFCEELLFREKYHSEPVTTGDVEEIIRGLMKTQRILE